MVMLSYNLVGWAGGVREVTVIVIKNCFLIKMYQLQWRNAETEIWP